MVTLDPTSRKSLCAYNRTLAYSGIPLARSSGSARLTNHRIQYPGAVDENAYRSAALLCPCCPETLRPILLTGATVDLCDHCGGVWFDWFDGDASSLARELAPVTPAEGLASGGQLRCPRCVVALHDEVPPGCALPVLRCSSCAGFFASALSLRELAALASVPDDAPRDEDFWARLLRWLQGILG